MGSEAPLIDIAEDKLVQFETAVMTVPQFDPENPVMISQGPSLCVFNKSDPQEVLASWLFAQFMLTDEVQIAYSQTEGYAPVTSKAQNSDVYRDYLAREGEDNQLYYDIKLKASKLLLENTDNTFVTPVFNGSASLRDAAGQLIENTVKGVRRGQTVDDAYGQALYGCERAVPTGPDGRDRRRPAGAWPAAHRIQSAAGYTGPHLGLYRSVCAPTGEKTEKDRKERLIFPGIVI